MKGELPTRFITNEEFEEYLDNIGAQYANLGGGDYAVYLNNYPGPNDE